MRRWLVKGLCGVSVVGAVVCAKNARAEDIWVTHPSSTRTEVQLTEMSSYDSFYIVRYDDVIYIEALDIESGVRRSCITGTSDANFDRMASVLDLFYNAWIDEYRSRFRFQYNSSGDCTSFDFITYY